MKEKATTAEKVSLDLVKAVRDCTNSISNAVDRLAVAAADMASLQAARAESEGIALRMYNLLTERIGLLPDRYVALMQQKKGGAEAIAEIVSEVQNKANEIVRGAESKANWRTQSLRT